MSNIWLESNPPIVLRDIVDERDQKIIALTERNTELLAALKVIQVHASKMMFVMRHVDRVIERAGKKL